MCDAGISSRHRTPPRGTPSSSAPTPLRGAKNTIVFAPRERGAGLGSTRPCQVATYIHAAVTFHLAASGARRPRGARA
eukprot:2970973-Pyramimonas_sp.AAC.1